MAIWTRLNGLIFGGAIGAAARDAVAPVLEPVRQHAWQENANRVLDPGSAARLVAQALIELGVGEDEASRNGYDGQRFEALVQLAQVAPSIAEAFTMRRRGTITEAELRHAYAKAQIEPRFWDALDNLLGTLLSPSEVANAVQQGHLPNDGILPDISPAVEPAGGAVVPVAPDGQPPSHVPLTQIKLDPHEQAAGAGVSAEQLQVLANLAGLPPGAETVLAMWNRGLIDEPTVDAGIREGHLKTKWAGAFKRMRWAVLSGQEYAEARLRDWITEEEMYQGGALTGHTREQMDLFYKNRGRTATPRQLWLGWARKVVGPNYPGQENRTSLTDYQDHEEAIRRSNIRPEYAKLLWAIRFNYPPLFQLNRLVAAEAIDADTAALWASYNLEAPDVIEALHKFWSKPAGATSTKQETAANLRAEYEGYYITEAELRQGLGHLGYAVADVDKLVHLGDAARVAKARGQVVDAAHKSYTTGAIGEAQARDALAQVKVDGHAIDNLLALWTIEKGATQKALSPAQIRAAYRKNQLSQAEALADMEAHGYTATDAAAFLGS